MKKKLRAFHARRVRCNEPVLLGSKKELNLLKWNYKIGYVSSVSEDEEFWALNVGIGSDE